MKDWSDIAFWGVAFFALFMMCVLVGAALEIIGGVKGAALCSWFVWAFLVLLPCGFCEDSTFDKMRQRIEKVLSKK